LDRGTSPLNILYRVNAGRLPEKHWYHDRRQGGRLIGEACHFVDTCNALVGEPAVQIGAAGEHAREGRLPESASILLRYRDGSSAVIGYAADGHQGTSKERIEILGRGHTVVIDDFQKLLIDGRLTKCTSGKGHVEQLMAFAKGTSRRESDEFVSSMRLTLDAFAGLFSGPTFRATVNLEFIDTEGKSRNH
jgi:predicted dehydrogenase